MLYILYTAITMVTIACHMWTYILFKSYYISALLSGEWLFTHLICQNLTSANECDFLVFDMAVL